MSEKRNVGNLGVFGFGPSAEWSAARLIIITQRCPCSVSQRRFTHKQGLFTSGTT